MSHEFAYNYEKNLSRIFNKASLLGIICFGIFLWPQCSDNKSIDKSILNSTSINLDVEIQDTVLTDLFNIANNIYAISLETTKESIIGNIHNLAINDDYIFVGTVNDYFLFDKRGTYIKSPFNTGRGPGEVLFPVFCHRIINNKIWFNDRVNNRNFIKNYDIQSEKWSYAKIPTWANITKLVVDSDSTISYISNSIHSYDNKISFEFTFIRQNTDAIILDSISFGKSSSEFHSFFLLKAPNGGVYAMNPRGDSLTYIMNGRYEVIWRNYFDPIPVTNSRNQEIYGSSLLSYSTNSLLLLRKNVRITGNTRRFGSPEILLIDRVKGRASYMHLFLKNKTLEVDPNNIFLLGNDQFCIVMSPFEIQNEMKRSDDLSMFFSRIKISSDDNPILIFGVFS